MKSHIDDSVIICDEIIDVVAELYKGMPETVSTNSHD